MRTDGVSGRVREDRRRKTAFVVWVAAEDVAHRVWTYVCKIDYHADTIHFMDELFSGFGDAVPEGLVSGAGSVGKGDDGGVGVDVVAVVC